MTSLGERYISVDIEEHADFALRGAKVFEHIDKRLAANGLSLVRSPASPCMFDSVSFGGKVLRRRGAWRWELVSVVTRIGPAPPLRPILAVSSRIRDIALPDADVREAQYVPGVLCLVDHCVSKTEPTVAATLTFGGIGVPISSALVCVTWPTTLSLSSSRIPTTRAFQSRLCVMFVAALSIFMAIRPRRKLSAS